MELMPASFKDNRKTDPPSIPNPYPERRKIMGQALLEAGHFSRELPAKVSDNAVEVLNRRYLIKNLAGEPVEDHLTMFQRVADNLAQAEGLQPPKQKSKRESTKKAFYEVMASLRFLPNSPTLMNAGRELQQLSACFVLPVEDSLDSIFNAVKETAIIHKSGGGTGFAFSRLRPQGDHVGSTGGVASGPVSFISSFDNTTDVVKQGGTRRGANMGVLHVTHPDILKFVNAKNSGNALTNFNISVAATDQFMEQAAKGQGRQNLRNPRNGQQTGDLDSAELLDQISQAAWENGDPGLIFIDRVNEGNPNPALGEIEGTNPCITGDAWTMTSSGPKQIRDLCHHPVNLEWNGNSLPQSPKGFFLSGVKEVLALVTEEGHLLRLTRNHPVLKADVRQWTPAGDLKPGDRIELSSPRNLPDPPRWRGPGEAAEAETVAGNFQPWAQHKQIPGVCERNNSEFWKEYLKRTFQEHARPEPDGAVSLPFQHIEDRRILQRVLLRLAVQSESRNGSLYVSQEEIEWLNWALDERDEKPEHQGAPLTAAVKSLEPQEQPESVFDVQVPGANVFEANGVTVHNCGEQPLLPYESCNLGSINLAKMTRHTTPEGAEIDWDLLSETVKTAVRMLDNVITMNRYPIPNIEQMTKKTRRIGLGVMGLADLLIQLAIPYGTEAAAETEEALLSFIRSESYRASAGLAGEKGPYPAWETSLYCQEQPEQPLRNTAPTTIAPTGTISIIAGVSSGIEPIFAPGYVRTVMDGTRLPEVHPYIEAVARRLGFHQEELISRIAREGRVPDEDGIPTWVAELFQPAQDIPWRDHIKMQAAAQKHCDNAVSKTINMPQEAAPEDVKEAYLTAYRSGCKGITVYRDRSRESQVLQAGEREPEAKRPPIPAEESRRPEPRPRPRPRSMLGETFKILTGHGTLYVTINHDERGQPFEVFSNLGKAGGCDSAQMEAVSRLVSMSLRAGIEPAAIIDQLKGITCCPAWDEGKRISSGPDAIAHALAKFIGKDDEPVKVKPTAKEQELLERAEERGPKCPDCLTPGLLFRENCLICISCGWSRCE